VIWVDGRLALPECVALCEQPLCGAIEVPVGWYLVVEGIRAAADDVEQRGYRDRILRGLGVIPSRSTVRASSAVRVSGVRVRTSRNARVARSLAGSSAN
jgi:hypothetical protein